MKYSEVEPITREEAGIAFASGVPEKLCEALIGLVYHDPDWKWLQDQCLALAAHSDVDVAGLAVTSLGHLARIHRKLDLEKVLPVLERYRTDPRIGGRVEDALDDIETYLRKG